MNKTPSDRRCQAVKGVMNCSLSQAIADSGLGKKSKLVRPPASLAEEPLPQRVIEYTRKPWR